MDTIRSDEAGLQVVEDNTDLFLRELPTEVIGTGICLGRANGPDGKIVAQSYMVWVRNYYGKADMTFAHRGGYYVAKTECFGAGVMY